MIKILPLEYQNSKYRVQFSNEKFEKSLNYAQSVVTWRNFPRYFRATESEFAQLNPLYLAARRKIFHLNVQGHSYFSIICLFLFFHARENYATSKKPDDVLLFS